MPKNPKEISIVRRTVETKTIGKAHVFPSSQLAIRHMNKHFLNPSEGWWEVLPRGMERPPRLFENPPPEDPAHYQRACDSYAAAIERGIAQAESSRYSYSTAVGLQWKKGPDAPAQPPENLSPGATWLSLEGMVVKGYDGVIRTAFRHGIPRRATVGSTSIETSMYVRFSTAYQQVRSDYISPSYKREDEYQHLWRYEKTARKQGPWEFVVSPPDRQQWLSAWKKWSEHEERAANDRTGNSAGKESAGETE